MQYDENGYPIKKAKKSSSQQTTRTNGTTEPTTSASDRAEYPPPRELPPSHEGHQAPQSGPRYDEHGYPIKSRRQQERDVDLPAAAAASPPSGRSGRSSSTTSSVSSNRPPNIHSNMGTRTYDNNNSFNRMALGNQTSGTMVAQLQSDNAQQMPRLTYWSTGLFDIGDDWDIFVEGLACFSCEEGRLYNSIVNDKQNSVHCPICCGSFLCSMMCCCGVPIVAMINRRRMIVKYNIQGEGRCTSCMFACCCPRCSACQMHRELQQRSVYPGGCCCAPKKDPNLCVVF